MRIPPNAQLDILGIVRQSPFFDGLADQAAAEIKPALWLAHNLTLLDLRAAISHVYLRKKAPIGRLRERAIQRGLTLLAAFAEVYGVNQAICSTESGHPYSISFQPRPNGMNWTAEHAISFSQDLPVEDRPGSRFRHLEFCDFAHLTYKVMCATSRAQAGAAPDATATYVFIRGGDTMMVNLTIRECDGQAVWRTSLEPAMA